MKIAIVTGLLNEKPQSGGDVLMHSFISKLAESHKLQLVYWTATDGQPVDKHKVAAFKHVADNIQLVYARAVEQHFNKGIIQKLKAKARGRKIARYVHAEKSAAARKVAAFFKRDFTPLANYLLKEHAEGNIDIVQIDFPWMMGLAEQINHTIPVTFVSHESQHIHFKRRAAVESNAQNQKELEANAEAFLKSEGRYANHFHQILTLTTNEVSYWKQVAPKVSVEYSPLGLNMNAYKNCNSTNLFNKLLFISNGNHSPNLDAIRWYTAEVVPYLSENVPVLTVTGEHPEDFKKEVAQLSGSRVVFVGYVNSLPDTMEGAVSVVPMRIGSGIRVKILESMAAGCPVVSTHMGCEGIPAVNGESAMLADSAKDFAKAINRMFEEPELAAKVAANGRSLVVKHFEVDNAVQKRLQLLQSLFEEQKTG